MGLGREELSTWEPTLVGLTGSWKQQTLGQNWSGWRVSVGNLLGVLSAGV